MDRILPSKFGVLGFFLIAPTLTTCMHTRTRPTGVPEHLHTIELKLRQAENTDDDSVSLECVLTYRNPDTLGVTLTVTAVKDIVVRGGSSILFVAPLDDTTRSIFHGLAPKPTGHEGHDHAYSVSHYRHLSPGEVMVVRGGFSVRSDLEEPRAYPFSADLGGFLPFGCTLSYWPFNSVPADRIPIGEMLYVHTERIQLRAVSAQTR